MRTIAVFIILTSFAGLLLIISQNPKNNQTTKMTNIGYRVACFRDDGAKFVQDFSFYMDKNEAIRVCQDNNNYEATNHPFDDIVYKVVELSVNKPSIEDRFKAEALAKQTGK